MRGPAVLSIVVVSAVLAAQARGVQPCANEANCAQTTVGTAASSPGGTAIVPVSFRQGAGSGIGEVAAIAFTLTIPSGTPPPLTLANCTPSASDPSLPTAAQPDPAISNFKLVIENAYCTASRTHCLCPGSGSGINPDNFINVVIYGPNPLPTPGPSPVVIPTLPPNGALFTLALTVKGSTPAGSIPLHVLNQVIDAAAGKPPFTALLSVGDKNAVDQTCGAATPPCSDPNAVSLVVVTDGSVTVGAAACCGDSSSDGSISTAEATNAILALVNRTPDTDPAAQCTQAGTVTTADATKVILNLVNRTCNP